MSDGRNKGVDVRTVLVILGLIGGPLAVWGDSQNERGKVNEKIDQLEKKREEDRRNVRQDLNEAKEHIKLIDQNTQLILQEIRAMQAVQRERERRGR